MTRSIFAVLVSRCQTTKAIQRISVIACLVLQLQTLLISCDAQLGESPLRNHGQTGLGQNRRASDDDDDGSGSAENLTLSPSLSPTLSPTLSPATENQRVANSLLVTIAGGSSCDGGIDPKSSEFATCTCDLQPQNCDLNCCCDKDCGTSERAAFTSCKARETVSQRKCTYDRFIVTDNQQDRKVEKVDDLLCIDVDNNDERNYHASVCPANTATEFTKLLERKQSTSYSFVDLSTTPTTLSPVRRCGVKPGFGRRDCSLEAASATASSTLYTVGDAIKVVSNGVANGFLLFPSSIASAECSDTSTAGFMRDRSHMCTRRLQQSIACSNHSGNTLSVSSYVSPNVRLLASTSASDTQINIECAWYMYRGVNNTECTAATTSVSCAVDGDAVSISKAVTKVLLTIHYSNRKITSAQVSFELEDISTTLTTDGFVSINQHHAIEFKSAYTSDSPSTTSFNVYPRSGNPGYIVGKPVIAGTRASDNITDLVSSDPLKWFTLPKPSVSTQCLSLDLTQRSSISFGYNMVSSCLLDLTYEDFSACDTVRTKTNASLFRNVLNVTHVAKYGNSSQLVTSEWVTIVNAFDEVPGDTAGYECGSLTSVHLDILTARMGEIGNSQATIVGVRRSYQHSKLRFVCSGFYCDSTVDISQRTRSFEIRFSVDFIDVTQNLKTYVKDAPEVIGKLPNGFFYPFE
eukprot:m.188754 g.188754  ORF g.188754 m.188754 type:complete len:691 (+) comp32358_c0_seq6:171-2243(+)